MTDQDKVLIDDSSEVLMSPVNLTEVSPEPAKIDGKSRPFRLQDLFLNYDSFPENVRQQNAFKTTFCVYRIDPSDPRDIVVAACPQCHDTISCKDLDKDGTAKC